MIYVQKDRADGRRNGEPWSVLLECAKPVRGIERPWRIIVHRGWPQVHNRESPRAGRIEPRMPSVFAEYVDEATARAAFIAAVKNERTR